VRGGGDALDRALIAHFAVRHRFQLGVSSAEKLKVELSVLLDNEDGQAIVEVRGLDAASGLPKTIRVPVEELRATWDKHIGDVLATVQAALAEAPPEMSHDIFEDGILLTGGAAMTGLLARRIETVTGIRTEIAATPIRTVAGGLLQMLNA